MLCEDSCDYSSLLTDNISLHGFQPWKWLLSRFPDFMTELGLTTFSLLIQTLTPKSSAWVNTESSANAGALNSVIIRFGWSYTSFCGSRIYMLHPSSTNQSKMLKSCELFTLHILTTQTTSSLVILCYNIKCLDVPYGSHLKSQWLQFFPALISLI